MTLEKENKLKDIKSVVFGDTLDEVVSSMEILLMMLELDDDAEIIEAIKEKMHTGIAVLKKLNYKDQQRFPKI